MTYFIAPIEASLVTNKVYMTRLDLLAQHCKGVQQAVAIGRRVDLSVSPDLESGKIRVTKHVVLVKHGEIHQPLRSRGGVADTIM